MNWSVGIGSDGLMDGKEGTDGQMAGKVARGTYMGREEISRWSEGKEVSGGLEIEKTGGRQEEENNLRH